jgi:apolipoprotein N-acyltransferase
LEEPDLKADALGFIVLAALMFVVAAFPAIGASLSVIESLFIFGITALCAAFVWRHEKAPKTTGRWLMLALITLVGAPLFYGFSRLVAVAFFRTEPEASRFFDIILTVIIAPGLTFISLAGAVRSLLLSGDSN